MTDSEYIKLMAVPFGNAGPEIEKHNARLLAISQRLEADDKLHEAAAALLSNKDSPTWRLWEDLRNALPKGPQ